MAPLSSPIRYVVLSDVHFGAGNSVLTHFVADGVLTDPSVPSSTLIALGDCLRDLARRGGGPPPTLVFAGDVLDLALSTLEDAAMAFDRFLEVAFPASGDAVFDDRILFVPGNHDHHVWEDTREIDYLARIATAAPDQAMPAVRHTTPMFTEPSLTASLMTELARRHPRLTRARIDTAYPALGLASADRQRAVVISHGHYIESLYLAVTGVMNAIFPGRARPTTFEQIEDENFAWVDFFWSTLGRSGDAGHGVELIYDKLQDERGMRQILHNAAASLAGLRKEGHIVDWVDQKLLGGLFDWAYQGLQRRERLQGDVVLSADARAGLRRMIEGPLYRAVTSELGRVPADFTLLFGHTHKPFESSERFSGYSGVKLYNSGGWVVDIAVPDPLCGGSVLLIDSQLHVAALRMFNIEVVPARYAVSVAAADPADNPLFEWLRREIDPNAPPWNAFSRIASEAVARRAGALSAQAASTL